MASRFGFADRSKEIRSARRMASRFGFADRSKGLGSKLFCSSSHARISY